MSEKYKALLLAMVLSYCKSQGMTEQDVSQLFSRKNIKGGYKILADRVDIER